MRLLISNCSEISDSHRMNSRVLTISTYARSVQCGGPEDTAHGKATAPRTLLSLSSRLDPRNVVSFCGLVDNQVRRGTENVCNRLLSSRCSYTSTAGLYGTKATVRYQMVRHPGILGSGRIPGVLGRMTSSAESLLHVAAKRREIFEPEPRAGWTSSLQMENYSGKPIVILPPKFSEVRQGRAGNCPVVATLAALAHAAPERIIPMLTTTFSHR